MARTVSLFTITEPNQLIPDVCPKCAVPLRNGVTVKSYQLELAHELMQVDASGEITDSVGHHMSNDDNVEALVTSYRCAACGAVLLEGDGCHTSLPCVGCFRVWDFVRTCNKSVCCHRVFTSAHDVLPLRAVG